jgi:hypothetical protein
LPPRASLNPPPVAANFSFALSLLQNHIPDSAPLIVATSFDSEKVAGEKYPDALENVAKVRANKNCVTM